MTTPTRIDREAEADARPRASSSIQDDGLAARRGRAVFRAWRRGFREADLILGPFVDQAAPSLDEAGLDALERLLEADDYRLYAWATGAEAAPAEHDAALIERLRAFTAAEVAATTAAGNG